MSDNQNPFENVQQKKKATSGAWKPGQSGNPAGRPRKNNALSAILSKAAKKNITIIDSETGQERKITRNELIAEMLMGAVTTGRVTFPQFADEESPATPIALDNTEWIRLLDFYYKRVEGNPGTKPIEEDDGDKYDGMTKEEAEAISEERWKAITPQLQEALFNVEEHVNTHEDDDGN